MLSRIPFYLKKPYIEKPLESNALKNVLDSHFQTAYRLYLIANDIEELQYFANLEDSELEEEYFITAYVKTECGFVGEAKTQVWNITHLQPLLAKKPRYTLRCNLRRMSDNVEIYRCNYVTTQEQRIYNLVQQCIEELNILIRDENLKKG